MMTRTERNQLRRLLARPCIFPFEERLRRLMLNDLIGTLLTRGMSYEQIAQGLLG